MATLPRTGTIANLISIDAVAARLGVSRRSIYRLIGRGEIATIQVGGQKRIEPSEVERFKTANRVRVAPPQPPPALKPQPRVTVELGGDRYVQ
jgi:excisionase family DNA binding protein